MPQEKLYVPGERIGPFEVVRLMGIGGMGVLYEAVPVPGRHDDLLSLGVKRVVLKVARLDAIARDRDERRELVERFEREYKTLLGLMQPGHPNIVEVYEFGWVDKAPFMALEYVDGPSLEDVLATQPPVANMIEVFRQLCSAVALLHSRGTVHRDLKPANVQLREGEIPVVLDFGSCLPPSGLRITGPGGFIGTPYYTSPEAIHYVLQSEQLRPYLPAPTDDVWGLGVILYEMLTGDVPWQAPPYLSEALAREMLAQAPRHPSDINPRVPRALGDVALRLLERQVGRRPRDAGEALALLEAALRQGPPVTGVVPARPWYNDVLPKRDRRPANIESGEKRSPPWVRWPPKGGLFVLAALALGFALRWGMEVAQRPVRQPAPAAVGPGETKPPPAAPKRAEPPAAPMAPEPEEVEPEKSPPDGPEALAGQPLPEEPFPGQMLPPCPKKYVTARGGCWNEIPVVTAKGEPPQCPDHPHVGEVKEKDGRLRCYLAVIRRPAPSAEQPAKRKR